MRRRLAYPLALLTIFFVAGCSVDTLDADKMAYRLDEVTRMEGRFRIVDIDGDGLDEMVRVDRPGSIDLPPTHSPVTVFRLLPSGVFSPTDQLNVWGEGVHLIAPSLDRDGNTNALVSYLRNDTLFADLITGRTGGLKTWKTVAVATGEPRVEAAISYEWDSMVTAAVIDDLDRDGRFELVCVVTTGYARLPRGLFVFDLESGRRVGDLIVGAKLGRVFFGDFDGDGTLNALSSGYGSDNGAVAGGLSDRYAHVISFELKPVPEIAWSDSLVGNLSRIVSFVDRVELGKPPQLISLMTPGDYKTAPFWLQVRDPATGEVVLSKQARHTAIVARGLFDHDLDGVKEIIAVAPEERKIIAFEYDLKPSLEQRVPFLPSATHTFEVDLDGDGLDEVVVRDRESGRSVFLDRTLNPKAIVDETDFRGSFVRGGGLRPAIVGSRESGIILYELNPNSGYRWARARPVIERIALGMLILAPLFGGLISMRRSRVLSEYGDAIADTGPRALALVSPRGKILRANVRAMEFLEPDDRRTHTPAVGEIISFIKDAARDRAVRQVKAIETLARPDNPMPMAAMDPLPVTRFGRPFWLFSVDVGREGEGQNRTWSLMAQRVAHDLKNPLTSILLSARHIQNELERKHPDASPTVSRQIDRIVDRIEYLRRNTNSFLKIVDLSDPELERTELDDFVRATLEPIRHSMPPDIRLETRLLAGSSVVALDHDQMRSVLEGLISNSVNAMPEGGKITVVTAAIGRIIRPSRPFGGKPPTSGEFATIEVQDTGKGIEREILNRVFEPGFTTSENGSGLGLAIAKKVMVDHGGQVVVESEPGAGTAVCLYIPLRSGTR